MSRGNEVFRLLQTQARRAGTPSATSELLTHHLLESFLERLTRTVHGSDFVLKGGVLVGVYGARRPTKDVDANAISADITPDHLQQVILDIANVKADDGVQFDTSRIDIRTIRDEGSYPGLRVRVPATIGSWKGIAAWDVTTGDPIIPPAQQVVMERLLGAPVTVWAYSVESILAEKGVTILERGITSTRWRDYVDIVQLAQRGFSAETLHGAAHAVATYRGVNLEPVGPHLAGYGSYPGAQAKWFAWRRKEHLEALTHANLDDQVAQVSTYLDPIFNRQPSQSSESP